jgi:hypothetical protein
MNNKYLEIKAKCKGHNQCYINKEEEKLIVSISITNKYNKAIGFPVEFFQSTGPSIKLIDKHSNKETYVPTSLANFDIENNYTLIQPGKSLIIEHTINCDEFKQFAEPNIDVLAEIIVVENITVDGKRIGFDGSDTIRIIGKDKS